MKKIITLILIIASCIWAFNIKNLSDCSVSERFDINVPNSRKEITIKCQNPVKYEINVDIEWHELSRISEYIYTENGKKTDALFFAPDGAHHEISEMDEYGVYLYMNNQIISSNKLEKLLMKKWEYFKKLKRQIENQE